MEVPPLRCCYSHTVPKTAERNGRGTIARIGEVTESCSAEREEVQEQGAHHGGHKVPGAGDADRGRDQQKDVGQARQGKERHHHLRLLCTYGARRIGKSAHGYVDVGSASEVETVRGRAEVAGQVQLPGRVCEL